MKLKYDHAKSPSRMSRATRRMAAKIELEADDVEAGAILLY